MATARASLSQHTPARPIALVTGVGRAIGIGAAVAATLAADGWDVVTSGWREYDERMDWGADSAPIAAIEADFADAEAPAALFTRINEQHGPVTALVCCHCESVDSGILDSSVETFDRHYAVNVRAMWLLIKAFAEQFRSPPGTGRIIAFTSDALIDNVPYGATKGALDRIVRAAAVELAHLGLTANAINPGATDTGWMDDHTRVAVRSSNLQPRIGTPADSANLVRFLCSPEGQWINGQVLYSDGGVRR